MYEIVSSRGLIQSDVLTCSLHKRFQILRFQFLFASHRLIVPVEILNGESISVVVVNFDGKTVTPDGRVGRQVAAVDPIAGGQVGV